MDRSCLKCGYSKNNADGTELETCPSCGAIYSRVESQRQASKQPPPTSPWRLSPWAWPVLIATLLLLGYNHITAPVKPKNAHQATPTTCDAYDAQCIGERDIRAASSACKPMIEADLRYSHEWTDGFPGEKFDRVMLYQPGHTVIYHGSSLRVQNGFGAWQKMRYFCVWDFNSKRAIKTGFNN